MKPQRGLGLIVPDGVRFNRRGNVETVWVAAKYRVVPAPDLFSLDPPLHRNPRYAEIAAAEVIRPHLGPLLQLVYEAVLAAGARGLTGDELCALFPDKNPYSLRPRLTQLGPGRAHAA